MRKKQIAIDCRMVNSSGIGVYIKNLIPLCITALPQTAFTLIGPANLATQLQLPHQESLRYVQAQAPIYSLREQLEISKIVSGLDALWVPHYTIPLLTSVPLAVTVHDVAHLALPSVFGPAKRVYAKCMLSAVKYKAKALFFDSAFTSQEFSSYIGNPRGVSVITPLGVSPEWFQHGQTTSPFPWPYIIAVGNLKPHKNLLALCHAFARLVQTHPHHLVLVGKKEGFRTGFQETNLETLAPGRIHCVGEQSFFSLRTMVHNAAWLIFPSIYEGFGFPPLEALASGTQVLAADIPPVRETCGDRICYFDPTSENNLYEALHTALLQPPPPEKACRGRRYAEGFTWEKTSEIITQTLKKTFGLY